ncbi:MAG TPA: cation diffusion facilitator family transporter [Thermoanaerobaculia bacterium]|nr:cation diffusion facilitator family transporter [Thermoanaerobaculia bacterium]
MLALGANLLIAAAKLASGLYSGSTALLAEAAHSLADAANEVLLGISLRRAAAPPDELHPLGHGRERFLWAFLAAMATFIIGGCYSVAIAIQHLLKPEKTGHGTAAWIVLAVAFVLDGISLLQGLSQARDEAGERQLTLSQYFRHSSDPTVRAVVMEDGAALVGLVIAAAGLLLSQRLGSGRPDAVASLLIGVLMAATGVVLALNLADFLVGKSLPPPRLEELQRLIDADDAVEELVSLQAVYIGPEEVVVAAKIRPSPELDAAQLGQAMDALDRALRDASPYVADVYIDVTAHRRNDGDDHG